MKRVKSYSGVPLHTPESRETKVEQQNRKTGLGSINY